MPTPSIQVQVFEERVDLSNNMTGRQMMGVGVRRVVLARGELDKLEGQKGKTENGRPRKLSDITIHGITDHLTKRITRKIKPNCIRNWKKRVRFRIDFKKVFSSFGTPLSNDAEERQWRKYTERLTSATETQRSQSTNADCATERRRACCT